MKKTMMMLGTLAVALTAGAPAMAHMTKSQMMMAKKCKAMSHHAMMRNKSCMMMKRKGMMSSSMMSGSKMMSGDKMSNDSMKPKADAMMKKN